MSDESIWINLPLTRANTGVGREEGCTKLFKEENWNYKVSRCWRKEEKKFNHVTNGEDESVAEKRLSGGAAWWLPVTCWRRRSSSGRRRRSSGRRRARPNHCLKSFAGGRQWENIPGSGCWVSAESGKHEGSPDTRCPTREQVLHSRKSISQTHYNLHLFQPISICLEQITVITLN